jgi:hypothetical protein
MIDFYFTSARLMQLDFSVSENCFQGCRLY